MSPSQVLFSHDGDFCHTESSPLIFGKNQWTGFYVIGTSPMKKLILTIKLLEIWYRNQYWLL